MALSMDQQSVFHARNIQCLPSTWICLLGPCRRPSHHSRSTIRWEVLIEHGTVPVSANVSIFSTHVATFSVLRFFAVWNIIAPFWLRVLHHLVRDVLFSMILQGINPAIANTVAKLLFLSPQDFLW